MKINTSLLLIPVTILTLQACDPGLNGSLKVYNHSDSVITVTVMDHNKSSTYTILPDSNSTIQALSGLGDNRHFDCCPCQIDTAYITTQAGVIKKDATKKEHWTIPNKGKLKRYGGEELKCELHIMPSDI